MTQQLYVDLAEMYCQIGFGGRPCQELYDLLEALFNEEEARMALNLSPFGPEAPEKLAERLKDDPVKVAETLDQMADKVAKIAQIPLQHAYYHRQDHE